jgi:hypothetical protein
MIDVAGEVREYRTYVTDICSRAGSVVLFDTVDYPEKCDGFELQYNKKKFEMYHFQPHSGE